MICKIIGQRQSRDSYLEFKIKKFWFTNQNGNIVFNCINCNNRELEFFTNSMDSFISKLQIDSKIYVENGKTTERID